MKKLIFTINGQPADPKRVPPGAQRLRDRVLALKPGELLTKDGLSQTIGLSIYRVIEYAGKYLPPEYSFKDGAYRLYGTPETIAAYKAARGIQD